MEPTREQRAAIEALDARVCVDAGAGSGKTRVLVEHMMYVLEGGHANLDEIVAITFTDKAAVEMKERLRAACRARASERDPRKMTFWRDIERRVETARVSTIHGFCMAFLKENALSLHIDPDFGILGEAEAHLLRSEVVESALHDLLERGDPAAQRTATEFGMGGLTGMLHGMLHQRQSLERFCHPEPPRDPAAVLDAWRKAVAAHNQARAAGLRNSPELGRIQRELEALAGCCNDVTDKREQLRVDMLASIDTLLRETTMNAQAAMDAITALDARGGSKKSWNTVDAFEAVKDALNELKETLKPYLPIEWDEPTDTAAAAMTCDLYAVYDVVERAFSGAKTARSSYDFDDLILGALRVLAENGEVRQRTARGIKHLLIDEFQDTDSRQLEIAHLLANEVEGPALFIVGDAKQSIYRFRGAEVEVFGEARGDSKKLVSLDRNFRSLPNVLEFVNDFFRTTGQLSAVEPVYGGLVADRKPLNETCVEFLLPNTAEESASENNASANEQLSASERRKEEAELIAWRIAGLCADSGSYGGVAVLFRAMSDLYIYESALRRHDIPYSVVAGAGFYERQEVGDIRNLLAVLVEPWDEVALLGFLRSPVVGLSDNALARICARTRLAEAFHCGVEDFDGSKRLEYARGLVRELRQEIEQPLPGFLRLVLDRTGYEAVLLSQFLGVQKAANVRKLLDLAEGFARAQTNSLRAFVRYIDEVAAQEIREGEAETNVEGANAVTLMSIHKSKGLEFPTVILPDLSRVPASRGGYPFSLDREIGLVAQPVDDRGERTKPSVQQLIARIDSDRDEAEHARVLYVGMTRARDRLILSGTFAKSLKGSWLASLDEVYALCGRGDGDEFGGKGWKAVVRRKAGAFSARPATRTAETTLSRETIKRRIAPVSKAFSSRKTFTVTELLELIIPSKESEKTAIADTSTIDPGHRGSIVHAFFEEWDGVGHPDAVIDAVLRRECPDRVLQPSLREDMRAIAERLRNSDLGKRMSRERDALHEIPFSLRIGDAVVNGAIDVLLNDGTIVDYKTGRRHSGLHTRHELQLRLYAAAVRQLANKVAPSAYLYYVDLGEQHEVDVTDSAVKHALARAEEAIRNAQEAAFAATE